MTMCSKRLLLITTVILMTATAARAQEFGPWSSPENLGSTMNSTANDNHPFITKDGLSLYFHSDRPGGFGDEDLYVSRRPNIDSPWGEPQNLGPTVNTAFKDRVPYISPNGKVMIFGSNRPGGCGGFDLWMSTRKHKNDDLGWSLPVNLGCDINSSADDDGAALLFDEENEAVHLYFTSNRARPGDPDGFDIYAARFDEDSGFAFGHPEAVPAALPQQVVELNTAKRDTRVAIRRDGLELFLTTNRPGGLGMLDIWVSRRNSTSEQWSTPIPVSDLNSVTNDGAPALSWDGTQIYFYSNRQGGLGGNDLYRSTRTRLYSAKEQGD